MYNFFIKELRDHYMKNFIINLVIILSTYTILYSQVPESGRVVESIIVKGLKSGTTKITIHYNQDMLRESIYYEKPDTNGIYQPSSKYLYEYNEFGKFTLFQNMVFTGGEWVLYEKRIAEYNLSGNEIRSISMNIFGNMVDLDTISMRETTYDEFGNIIERIDKFKVYGGGMQNSKRNTFEYTASNKVKSQSIYKWENNAWVNYGLIHKSYNEYDSLICDSTFMWKENDWVNSMLYIYGYDDARNLSLLEIYINEDNQWIKMEQYRYGYDEKRRRVETIKSMRANDEWVENSGRGTVEYRSDGQIANEKGYNLENSEWKVVAVTEYKYNGDNKNTEILYKILVEDVWTNNYRYIYEYSNDNILQNLKYQVWKDNDWQKSDNLLIFRDKYNEYSYNCYELNLQWLPLSVEELQVLSQISLYPNPASDYIGINGLYQTLGNGIEKVQIFNTLGIEVGQSSLTGDNSQVTMQDLLKINISQLPAGVYFVKVGGTVIKFVKI